MCTPDPHPYLISPAVDRVIQAGLHLFQGAFVVTVIAVSVIWWLNLIANALLRKGRNVKP